MSALGDLENALWRGEYQRLADSHFHRAMREDSQGIIKGRDAILAKWVETAHLSAIVTADLGDMVAVQSSDKDWQLHRWVWREDGRILREVEITNRNRPVKAAAIHPPLGELRAGRGQYAADAEALLPPGFPDAAVPLANRLHNAWNGRAFSAETPKDIINFISDLPDATFFFEHAVAENRVTAILFRLMGHDESGRRIRLFGSYLGHNDGEMELVLDWPGYAAQKARDIIDYGQLDC
ncbi:MAG: hypothetical protein IBJ12_11795 [Sphingomonadaceae bacterium]|nr:hypothetical protein [Sphingomonadaceae bacterium]